MKILARRFRDSSNSRIGTYEAFLDLLTLFCFALMFAAAIYVAQPTSSGSSKIATRDATRGSPPRAMAAKSVELKLSKVMGINKLTVLDGTTGRTLDFEITGINVRSELASIESSLRAASNIYVAAFEDSQQVDAEVLVEIQRWLA
jgi:hypothetical protein